MKRYERDHRKHPQIPFTQSDKPMIRFWGDQARPIMHLNRAAVKALDEPARVSLSWDEESRVIEISATEDKDSLLLWCVTPFYRALSATGFVTWAKIIWPSSQSVEAEVLGSDLWLELPQDTQDNKEEHKE